MNQVYIANFGRHNYAWERCRDGGTVATMNDEDSHEFWLAGDRNGYINHCIRTRTTSRGNPVPKQTAARWANLMTELSSSVDDYWFHRDGDQLWWTRTKDEPAIIDPEPRSVPYQEMKVFECHKPCQPWSDRDLKGSPLLWGNLHTKAKQFLSTEQTFQVVRNDVSSAYALALISGKDLSPWHNRLDWKILEDPDAGFIPGQTYTREDVATIIGYPKGQHTGGAFATGYVEWDDAFYIFCGLPH